MRVLYVVGNYPCRSETYVAVELAWVLARGVTAAVWASQPVPTPCVGVPVPGAAVYTGTLRAAIADFRPDILHAHWLHMGRRAAGMGLPVTVHGHSFDFTPAAALALCQQPSVKALFLYPHFVPLVGHAKAVGMRAAYDNATYRLGGTPKLPVVLRCAGGLPGKGLESHLDIAAAYRATPALPPATFMLVTTTPLPDYTAALAARNAALGNPVDIHLHNLPPADCAMLMQGAAVYLRGHDTAGHPYGQPVSIAEALACGCMVVAQDCPAARDYIGPAGTYYDSVPGAMAAIAAALAAPQAYAPATLQAARHRPGVVLPPLLTAWQKLV